MHTPVSVPHIRTPYAPWRIGLLLAALLGFGSLSLAQQSAARVMAVSGPATATDTQGRERTLEKGTELFSGDKVVTAEGALVQMRTHDGGYLSVRPGTALVIDRFVHDDKDASNSTFLLSLLRGGFRSITGLIGRTNPAGYQIRSSTATIGIRGTDHEPMLVLDSPTMQALGAPGLYDKVNDGETFIRNQNGVLSLQRGDVGFAPQASDTPPQVLLKIPDFYKLELKADARDSKDGANGKSDGKRAQLLRPTLAARREALLAGDGKAVAPVTNPVTKNLSVNNIYVQFDLSKRHD
ncbi:MAG: FecR domain-containing protein [Burkholderiales bacterium]|nr:FecR domain-containing protein [Burkholderiales bacterium]